MSSPLRKTAILMPNWLGDCVLALAVIEKKRELQGDTPTLILPAYLVDLFSQLTDIPLIPFRRASKHELSATLRDVRMQGFEKFYVVPHSFSSALFAFRSRIPHRRGIRAELRQILLTDRLPPSLAQRERHLTIEIATVLEAKPIPLQEWLGVPLEPLEQHKGKTVLCPSATYGPAKKWNGFSELAGMLGDREILVLGGEADRRAGEEIVTVSPGRITNLAGRTSLLEAARIIAGAKLVVANDSGLMHLAGFLGTPLVGIFCSTSPAWTQPLGGNVRIARAKIECSPCFKKTCRFDHYKCLSEIGAQSVVDLTSSLTSPRTENTR